MGQHKGMKTTATEIATWLEAALESVERYDGMGLRIMPDAAKVGDILDPSWVWVDGEQTDDRLDGTSCLDVRNVSRAARLAGNYVGVQLALIGADYWTYGEDEGEIVMRDPVVLAVLDL